MEDTPERSVAPFRVGHFKAWRTELKCLKWPWPLGVWTCVFSMNLGVYYINYIYICYAICNIYIYIHMQYYCTLNHLRHPGEVGDAVAVFATFAFQVCLARTNDTLFQVGRQTVLSRDGMVDLIRHI